MAEPPFVAEAPLSSVIRDSGVPPKPSPLGLVGGSKSCLCEQYPDVDLDDESQWLSFLASSGLLRTGLVGMNCIPGERVPVSCVRGCRVRLHRRPAIVRNRKEQTYG